MNLFKDFDSLDNNAQGNYLLANIEVLNINRRRTNEATSRRQCTISFFVPKESGEHARVCKKTFMIIFGIISSKRIETLVKKTKQGDTSYRDLRGGPMTFKFTKLDREQVKKHIQSIPTEPSHYSRVFESRFELYSVIQSIQKGTPN